MGLKSCVLATDAHAGWAGTAASRKGSRGGKIFRPGFALRSRPRCSAAEPVETAQSPTSIHVAAVQVIAALEAGRDVKTLVAGTRIRAGYWSIAVPPALSDPHRHPAYLTGSEARGAADQMLLLHSGTVGVISNSGEILLCAMELR